MGDHQVRAAAAHKGEHATTESVAHKPRTGELRVPFAEVSTVESLATGFRQQMLDLRDETLGEGGGVQTGGGLGSDFITLNWNGRTAVVRGLDLLRVWVETFSPEDAKRFPEGLS